MPTTDRTRWARDQIDALISIGDSPQEASEYVQWLLSRIPLTVDPEDYQLTYEDIMASAAPSNVDVDRARRWWYAADVIPPEYKRLLDAITEGDDA